MRPTRYVRDVVDGDVRRRLRSNERWYEKDERCERPHLYHGITFNSGVS